MLTKALLCARRRAGLTCRSVQLTQHNSPHPTRLFRSSAFSRGNNNDDDDMYKIQVPPIPQEKLTITFSTSSGPGGQNVNKVNTRAELRFNVREADWIPEEMLERFMELHKSRIVKSGEMVIVSQRFRVQSQNIQDCLDKLKEYLEEASHIPKPRLVSETPEFAKAARIKDKKRRSDTKRSRQASLWD